MSCTKNSTHGSYGHMHLSSLIHDTEGSRERDPKKDKSKGMAGVFSFEALFEAIKAKEACWVLAVPEVATCLLENAGGFWATEPDKFASMVVCAGLVGKGALHEVSRVLKLMERAGELTEVDGRLHKLT